MHAGIVLSAVSVIKDPKLGSMKFGFFFLLYNAISKQPACQQHTGFSNVFALN